MSALFQHSLGDFMQRLNEGWLSSILISTAVAALPSLAGADEEAAVELQSVTVTARLSEEEAKEVPFSVSVLSGEALETRRLVTLEDALRQTPGVDVNSSGGASDANIRIRGVGSLYQVNAEDGSVVIHMDGVPLSGRDASLSTLDVERVEILKGPQGTLFGRNSEAGAINIRSRRPTREREGYLRIEGGQEGQHLEEAAVGGALSETLMARLAVRNSGSDNPVDNDQTGDPVTYQRDLAFRGSLLWEIAPSTSAFLSVQHQEMDGQIPQIVLMPYDDHPSVDVSRSSIDDNEKTLDIQSLEIQHDLANSRITSVTSYNSSDLSIDKVYGRKAMQALYGYGIEYPATDISEKNTFNQDLRWSSLPESPVFWVMGVNVTRSKRTLDSIDHLNDNAQDRRFDTHSDAVYGEVTYPLGDAFKVTGGWRHTWDRKRYGATYRDSSGHQTPDSRRLSDNYDTGRVALSYALNPATNVYGVLSRGYKSGGFNDYATQAADSEPYRAAIVNTAELGFKSESEDGRFDLSGALYFNSVTDDHLLGYEIATMATQAVNADTESLGAELQGTWRVGGGLSLSGGLSYIDATITSDATGVQGGDVESGNQVPDVPRWSGLLNASYQRALDDFWGLSAPVLNAHIDYRYNGSRPADPQNHFDLDAYHKIDLHLGLLVGDAEVYFWADNLLDERYDLYGYYLAPGINIGMPSRDRTLGLGVSYLF